MILCFSTAQNLHSKFYSATKNIMKTCSIFRGIVKTLEKTLDHNQTLCMKGLTYRELGHMGDHTLN